MPSRSGRKHPNWGGARPGAGRKPRGARAGVPHTVRPRINTRIALHLRISLVPGLIDARQAAQARRLREVFGAGAERFGFRLLASRARGDAIDLLARASSARALGRGMKGLGVRLARGLNRLVRHKGHLFADRYQVCVDAADRRCPDRRWHERARAGSR